MTAESEWPDEAVPDEPETELKVENKTVQPDGADVEHEPSEEADSAPIESQDEEEEESTEEQQDEATGDDFGEVTLPVRARQVIQISESSFEIPLSQTKDGKKTISMLIDEETVRIATTTFLPGNSAKSIIDSVYAKETLTGYSFTQRELKRFIPYSAGISFLGLILSIIPAVNFLAYALLIAGLTSLAYVLFDPLMVELSFSGSSKKILFSGLTSDKNMLTSFSEFTANSFPEILNGEVIDTTEIDLLAKEAIQPAKPSPTPPPALIQAPVLPITAPIGNLQSQPQTIPQTIPQTMPQTMPQTIPQTIPQTTPQSTPSVNSGVSENQNLSMLTSMDEVPSTPNKPVGPPVATANPQTPPAPASGIQLPPPPAIPNPPAIKPMGPPSGNSVNLPPPPQQIPQINQAAANPSNLPAPLPAPVPQPTSLPAPLPTNASFLPPPPTNTGTGGFSDPLGKEFEQNKEPETYVVQGEAVVETLDEGQKDELLKELL